MHEQRADALQLAVGQPAALVTNGAVRAITRDPLNDGQIAGLVKEIAGAESPKVGAGAACAFGYQSPSGEVRVEVTPGADRAVLRPARAEAGAAAGAVRGPDLAEARAEMDGLLRLLVEAEASDLHLRSGEPPLLRLHGEIVREQAAPIPAERLETMLLSIMSPREIAEFREGGDTDWAYEMPDLARFRCNAGRDRHGPIAVFRVIPTTVRTADEMGLSREVQNLCYLTKGLVVVTGPTGSGKSTTLAALVDLINRTRTDHIITIEDPIEFVHQSKKCLVTQRQVGAAHPLVQAGPARRAARGPRHHPGRRDARPGDGLHRDRDRGDRPPGLRHAAHHDGRLDRRPDHRPVPGRPAGPGAGDAVRIAARRHRPDALQEDRRRAGGRARDPALHSGGVEPDPGREDLPDPVHHADQPQGRHGHAERRADGAGRGEGGGAEGGLHEGGGEGRIRRRAQGQAARYRFLGEG